FLHEAQLLPSRRRVIRIEDPSQRLRFECSRKCADEVSGAEFLEVKVIRRSSRPETQRVDCLSSVANHRAIKRNSPQAGRPIRNHFCLSVSHLETTVHFDFNLLVASADLPWISVAQPIVGSLLLPSVHK